MIATPYTAATQTDGSTRVMVGTVAAKRVKQDASPRTPNSPLRWRSLDGQVFDTLQDVADSMAWALH